jgi:hypothetical protein
VLFVLGEKVGISFDFCNMFVFNDWIDFFYLLDYPGMNKKYSWARGGNSTHMALLDQFFVNGD